MADLPPAPPPLFAPAASLATLPPGPRVAAARQTLRWLGRPYELLRECGAAFGDAFTLDFGAHGAYAMFSAPEAVRAIFTADAATLHAGEGNEVLRPLLGPGSLLLLEEERHHRERRLLMPSFHARRVEAHGELIRRAAEDALARFAPGSELNVQEAMQEVSLRVILRAVFGVEDAARAEELARELLAFLNDPKLNLAYLGQLREDVDNEAWRVFQRRLERIDGLLYEEIARRRALGDLPRHDVLSVLLGATYEDGAALGDAALRDELMTLLATGYETTATALAWAFHAVHADPEVERRLRDELAALGPDPAPAALAERAPYLRAVCFETLRIRPILPVVARRVVAPLVIQGFAIPAGVTVAACVYLAHHRPSVFPEPDRFSPERFLDREYSPYEYLPFGGGARRCLGMTLALFEMKIVLAAVLARCELSPVGPPVRPVRRSVTIGPSGGARMRVKRRR